MGDQINKGIYVGGHSSFEGETVIVGDNTKTNVGGVPQPTAEIAKLLEQFRADLAKAEIPPADRETITALANQVESEARKETPNRKLGAITANGLKEAAETVKDIAPTLLTIAATVAKLFVGA